MAHHLYDGDAATLCLVPGAFAQTIQTEARRKETLPKQKKLYEAMALSIRMWSSC